jgi:hypothetical protein
MLIGITGKLQAGKTTVAGFIKEKHPFAVLLAFSDLLKEMIFKAGLCTREELWEKKTDFSRLMMQKIGTEIVRDQIDQDFWVKKMDELVGSHKGGLIIIHDVRFLNEANFISNRGGVIIRVIRPSMISTSVHRSETEMSRIKEKIVVFNDGDLESLNDKIERQDFIEILKGE